MNKKEIINKITKLLMELCKDEQISILSKDNRSGNAIDQYIDKSFDNERISTEKINRHQLEELEYELDNQPEIYTGVIKRLRINRLVDMESSQYRPTINEIRRLKLLREGKCICRSRGEVNLQN
jgi:hypothetical protein